LPLRTTCHDRKRRRYVREHPHVIPALRTYSRGRGSGAHWQFPGSTRRLEPARSRSGVHWGLRSQYSQPAAGHREVPRSLLRGAGAGLRHSRAACSKCRPCRHMGKASADGSPSKSDPPTWYFRFAEAYALEVSPPHALAPRHYRALSVHHSSCASPNLDVWSRLGRVVTWSAAVFGGLVARCRAGWRGSTGPGGLLSGWLGWLALVRVLAVLAGG
jgi:hypothetical protein